METQSNDSKSTRWNKVYLGVFITGILFVLIFWWFTTTFNLP